MFLVSSTQSGNIRKMSSLTEVELAGLRLDQEAELDATCTIWRNIDEDLRTISKVTGVLSAPTTTTIFTGACFCAPIVSRRDRFDTHGEQQIYQNQYRVLLPHDAGEAEGGIRIGDFIRITVSEDPDFLLKDMTVKDVLLVSDISLRRLTTIDIEE